MPREIISTITPRKTTAKPALMPALPDATPAPVLPPEGALVPWSMIIEPAPSPKAGFKLDLLVTLLQRPEGASLAELSSATGWQAHSIRGALAGSLKRKGHTITSERIEGIRRYQIEVGA